MTPPNEVYFSDIFDPSKRTLYPVVTGSSVLALIYKDGVMMVTDTLASYGSMSRYKEVKRVWVMGDSCMISGSGEYSDMQWLTSYLSRISIKDWSYEDNQSMSSKEYASMIGRIMYNKRSRFNPLWNSIVVAGYDHHKPYLGYVDLYGTAFEEQFIATGLGRYFALTHLRNKHNPDMTEDEARLLLEECMRILFYRDKGASNRIQISTATSSGIRIREPYVIQSNWSFDAYLKPTKDMSLAGCSW